MTLKLQSDILHSVKDCTLLLLLGEEFTINLFSVTTARRQQEVWDSELPVWHNIHCGVLPRADLQPRGWWVAVVVTYVTWDMFLTIHLNFQSTGSVTNQSPATMMELRNTRYPEMFLRGTVPGGEGRRYTSTVVPCLVFAINHMF